MWEGGEVREIGIRADEVWYREAGGTDNGKPGIRKEMSRQPYYVAFVKDCLGNNIEAVHVVK